MVNRAKMGNLAMRLQKSQIKYNRQTLAIVRQSRHYRNFPQNRYFQRAPLLRHDFLCHNILQTLANFRHFRQRVHFWSYFSVRGKKG